MAVYVLSWPGLPDIPFYIIDPKSNRLYSAEKPLPPDRLSLDVFENRYVKLSKILELFSPNMVPEAHFILENLQRNFNVKQIARITEKRRQTTSYLPVEVLLAMIFIWPLCNSFQSTKRTLLNYLDHFPESVCMDCGYVNRDCKCGRTKANSKNAFVGFATTFTEKGVQTDAPMPGMNSAPAFSNAIQANNQGMSMAIPSGAKLPAGMKFPMGPTVGQIPPLYYPAPGSLGLNMLDANTNPFSFLRPPMGTNHAPAPLMLPPRSHRRGRPPVSPFPYLYQTNVGYQPSAAFYGPYGGDGSHGNISNPSSLMHMPGLQGFLAPDFSIQGCLPTTMGCGFNYMQPLAPSGANSTPPIPQSVSAAALIGGASAGEGFHPMISRKRKYSGSELEWSERCTMVRTVAVQTSTKSFIKKSKLKEEKLAEKIDGPFRGSAAPTIADETQENVESSLIDSGGTQNESSQSTSRLSVTENLGTSPGKNFPYSDFARRDDRDNSSKRFGGNLWRRLDDNSDDDKPTGRDGNGRDGSDDKVARKLGVGSEGKGAATVDASRKSSVKIDQVPLENNNAEGNKVVKSEDLNENDSSALEDGCREHGVGEIENGVDQKTGETGSGLNDGSSIRMRAGSDDLAPGSSSEKLHQTGKVPSAVAVIDVDDSDSDKDEKPIASAVAGPSRLDVPPTSLIGQDESDVFRALLDEIGDGRKTDPTGDISTLDQENVSPAQRIIDGKKKDGAAADDVSPVVVGHLDRNSGDAEDGVSARPVVRKIYGKFEYLPTQEHIFRCLMPKCSQSFDTRLAAEMHNLVHPGGSENVSHLKCPKCEFTVPFYHWFDLVRHMRQSHQMLMSREPFSCKLCGLVFESEDGLTSHIDFHYSNRYKCIHCGLLLLTWGQVKRHLEGCADKHKGNLNLGCPYCTFVFHKKNIRNLHLLSHSDVGLACALCQDNAAWADWKTLRKHYQNRHTKTLQGKIAPFRHKLPTKRKPPRCKRCDVEFKSTELYVAHMTRTHDLVPYTLVECAICGHKFRTERSHEWHVKHVHVEEILCEKCDFVATSKSVMKSHVAQKHSDKQHTCSECEKSFAFYHQLKVHMAHHARHTIYPCQKCDQEFTRQHDLRQHLAADHDDPSDKAPQSCPECEYRCYSRANLNAHIKKLHPDLLEDDNTVTGVAVEEEEDGADHCYSTKKADAQPVVDLTKVRRFGRKKGRQRKAIKYEWDRSKTTDSYLSIEDRRERRRMNRMMKENDDRMKKLKKLTCARTRSYIEHQAMKGGGKAPSAAAGRENQSHQTRAAKSVGLEDSVGEFGAVETVWSGLYGVQPYLDHNYCKFESAGAWVAGERFGAAAPNQGQAESVNAPDVSAFQECETQLLGLTSAAPARRRGRPPNSAMNRTVTDARRKFTSVLESVSSGVMQSSSFQTIRLTPRVAPSTSTVETTADDDGLENLSTEIPDFELIAESDLLKNLGSYNIIDELFGMTQASGTGVSAPDHASKKVHLGDLPSAGVVPGFSFRSPRETGEATESLANTFSDGLVMDGEAQLSADFDDIELGEDVYSLFLGGGSGNTQTTNSVQLENGSDDLNRSSVNISASPSEVLSLMSLPATVSYLPNSVSPRGLASPRRIAGSSLQRTLPGLQNLNRNSSVGSTPSLTMCTVSSGAEGLPLSNCADRNAVERGTDSSYAPADTTHSGQSHGGSESKLVTGLLLADKSLKVSRSGPTCDDEDCLTFEKNASETLENTPGVPQFSSNLSAVVPEAPSAAHAPRTRSQSGESLDSERGTMDIEMPVQPKPEHDIVTVDCESPITEPASADGGNSGVTVG